MWMVTWLLSLGVIRIAEIVECQHNIKSKKYEGW